MLIHRFTVAILFGVLAVVTTWIWRDSPVLHRATPLIAVVFTFTSLAYGGFWASMISFVPGLAAAAYFLMEPTSSFAVSDPLEQTRLVITVVLTTAVAGMIAALRVDRQGLAARERQHRESEERYRTLLDQASDAIFVSDDSGRLINVNQSSCEMLGYSREELIGRDVRELISPDSLSRQPFRGAETIRDRPLVLAEREMVRKDGTRLVVEVSARHITDGRTQAIVRDITERRRAEDAMRGLEAQLQHSQRLEAVGRLAGGVAHDFNNVLTVVLGNAQLLATSFPTGPAAERIRDILHAGERASLLTHQLLAFSRKQAMQFRNVDLNAVVRGMDRLIQGLIGEQITLRLGLEPEAGVVRADPGQLEQVVLNLVVNSRDALPNGGTIEIRTSRDTLTPQNEDGTGEAPREYALLSVRDDGIGMDAETQSRVFEPFFTTKPPGAGTGLGLSTVYGIVRQSGGFVRLSSAPGKGTCFDVCLPALPAGTAADPPVATPSQAAPTEQQGSRPVAADPARVV